MAIDRKPVQVAAELLPTRLEDRNRGMVFCLALASFGVLAGMGDICH